jgi:hypothetical protein
MSGGKLSALAALRARRGKSVSGSEKTWSGWLSFDARIPDRQFTKDREEIPQALLLGSRFRRNDTRKGKCLVPLTSLRLSAARCTARAVRRVAIRRLRATRRAGQLRYQEFQSIH